MGRIKQRKRKARMVQVHNRHRKPVVMLTMDEFEEAHWRAAVKAFGIPKELLGA